MDLMVLAVDLSPPYSEGPAALVEEKLEDPLAKNIGSSSWSH